MSSPPTIAEAVAALKAWADTMQNHPGVFVAGDFYVEDPTRADIIAYYRANPRLLPPELVDLYELMNGCALNWGFRVAGENPDDETLDRSMWSSDIVGRINLTQLNIGPNGARELGFGTDYENEFTFFGPGAVSLFFDQMQPEYGTWLVAYGPDGPGAGPDEDYEPYEPDEDAAAVHAQADTGRARLVYVYEKTEQQPLPGTIAEYLMQGIAHGFVNDWPLAYQGHAAGAYGADDLHEQVQRYRDLLGA